MARPAPAALVACAAAALAASTSAAGLLLGRGSVLGAALALAVALPLAAPIVYALRSSRGARAAAAARPHLEASLAAFPDTVARVDRDGRIVDVLWPHPGRIFGSREELLGRDVLQVVPPAAAAAVGRAVASVLVTGAPVVVDVEGSAGPVELRVVRAARREALLVCRAGARPAAPEAGHPAGEVSEAGHPAGEVSGVGHPAGAVSEAGHPAGDVSAPDAPEDPRLLAALTREMADAVFVIDAEARIRLWTGGAQAIYGWRADEVLGRSIVELLSASLRSVDVPELRAMLLAGKPVRYRSVSRRRDGAHIICDASAVPLRDGAGRPTSALIVSRDVTREIELEEELARSRDRLASALESSGLGSWQLDAVTGALTYDRLWPELLGYGPDEIPRQLADWVALADPADVPRTRAAVFAHLKGRTDAVDCEFRLRDKAGSWRWIHTRARVTARDARGRALVLVGTHADVTRRREAEECMRAALEANVRLVAELREALASVKTLSGLLPVCAWCKKIRDDAGYWQRIESYLGEHSNATFTHGICPECESREFGPGEGGGATACREG